ncbi:MAG TPA: transketolase [Vicinamibacteria bacterium]
MTASRTPLQPVDLRRIILQQSKRANVGHIGSALSVADILAALYSGILRLSAPDDPDRDRFILSKGHAALALYAALHLRGFLDAETLDTYCADGSLLGVHPERALRGVDFATGSLGHGLSLGSGAALGARLSGSSRRAFVLVSDGELGEGSLWEAVMFAAHHRLANLVAIVDWNRQQALGYTEDVLSLRGLPDRFRAFGWDAHEVDGHDPELIARLVRTLELEGDGPPHVLLAHTTFGKGVSFMEGKIHWHYWPMSDEEYLRALAEIEAEGEG